MIGYTGDVTRFANNDRYAAYNGTAPIELSSAGRVVHPLSRRGNRTLNYAIHKAVPSSTARSTTARHHAKPYTLSDDESATPSIGNWSPTPLDAPHNGPGEGTQGKTHRQRGRLSP